MQESKQEVTKILSLLNTIEKLLSVPSCLKVLYRLGMYSNNPKYLDREAFQIV